ncbi:hypothetical protein NL108_015883 [Boleophthalmus pectinirostris]|nr:hypothetical protein NL108_015883 [Boleophthalmus pectinirostris]
MIQYSSDVRNSVIGLFDHKQARDNIRMLRHIYICAAITSNLPLDLLFLSRDIPQKHNVPQRCSQSKLKEQNTGASSSLCLLSQLPPLPQHRLQRGLPFRVTPLVN